MLEIINQKYMKFLFDVENKPRNISELAKIGDFTLSVASTLISRWARAGVIKKEELKKGKGTLILITEYGKIQVELLKQLNNNYLKNKEKIEKMLNTINGGEK